MGTAVTGPFAQAGPGTMGPSRPRRYRTLIGFAGRLANPAGLQRWILGRLQHLPDVAELT